MPRKTYYSFNHSIPNVDVSVLMKAKEYLSQRGSTVKEIPVDLANQKYISLLEVISMFDLLIAGGFDEFLEEYNKIRPAKEVI